MPRNPELERQVKDLNERMRNGNARVATLKETADLVVQRLRAEGKNPATDAAAMKEVDAAYGDYDQASIELRHLENQRNKVLEQLAGYGGGSDDGAAPVTSSTVALSAGQSFGDWLRARGAMSYEGDNLDLGKYLRGIATGNWENASYEAQLGKDTVGAGGALVPEPLAAEVIDLARNRARVFQAGARTIPMSASTLKIARLTGDAEATWKTENDPITASAPAFDQVVLTAQTLPVLVKASQEVVEDAPNAGEVLRQTFAEILGNELDRVCLYGTGTAPEPRGVRNFNGVLVVDMGDDGGELEDFDPFVDAIGELWDENHEPNAIIHAPRTERTLAKLKDTTNQPLQPPEVVARLRRYPTNQVPVDQTHGTAEDASDSFVADWRELLVGIRSEIRMRVLTERFADNLQYGFLASLRADCQVARPEAFCVIEGIVQATDVSL